MPTDIRSFGQLRWFASVGTHNAPTCLLECEDLTGRLKAPCVVELTSGPLSPDPQPTTGPSLTQKAGRRQDAVERLIAKLGFEAVCRLDELTAEQFASILWSYGGPTVSAANACLEPNGFGRPTVLSFAVCRSISEFSSAPRSTMTTLSQIQVMKPAIAPIDP